MDESPVDVTEDRVLGGRATIFQLAKGYRAGLDAALLAAACDAHAGETVLEPGCGVGAALLAAAVRRPGVRFVGLERDPGALALAQRGVLANGLGDRVEAVCGDIALTPPSRARFDAAICNPPYFDDAARMRGPHATRRGAYIADDGLAAWVTFLLASVREGGSILMIHRAERLPDLIASLGRKAGSLQVRPILPFSDQPASRVIVRAVRGGRAPFRLLPPLVVHAREGAKHTAEAEAILRGEDALAWV